MSNRRRLRPSETARQDQALAAGRNLADTGNAAVVTLGYADRDAQCSWCDCAAPVDDPDSPHHQAGYECGGCDQQAHYVVHVNLPGRVERFPVCARHRDDLMSILARTFRAIHGDIPAEFHTVPILDEEMRL